MITEGPCDNEDKSSFAINYILKCIKIKMYVNICIFNSFTAFLIK